MSTVFSKNKEKRARTSSGESNNSFVKNVTSRVSGLLPATITKWFSSPSSNANGSAPAADATDSSTEDEAPESPVTAQPPAKRMRFSPGSAYGNADANCVTSNIDTIDTQPTYTVQSPPGRTTFRRETNFVSTPITRSEDTTLERTDKETTTTFQQHTVSTIGPSIAKKRKSIFGNQSQDLSDASKKAYVKTSNNTVKDPRQPSFKPTLLGSPFYAGRTTYGGAASSYINQPNITQRQNTTVKESPTTNDNNISHSARRVMELLESYSSPLMEAKRIPPYTRPTRQEIMKRNSESSTSSPYSKINSVKTQELHVPSIASILRLKQRSRLNDTTNAARQLIASHSSSSPDYMSYSSSSKSDQADTDKNTKLTTKVKSRLTRLRPDNSSLDMETITPIKLPNAVLQIDPNNLPNFSIPVAPKTTITQKTFDSNTNKSVETKSKPETKPSSSIYNFANPVRITSESPATTSTPPKFTFGSPERSIEKPRESEKQSPEVPAPVTKEKAVEPAKASADWKCPDCWVNNKQDADKCVCCGYKQAPKPSTKAKCTLCKLADSVPNGDKCVNCEKMKTNNIAKPLKVDTSKWKCDDCWVSNEESAEKCACCGAKNPKGASQTVPAKKPETGGMCPTCYSVMNNGKCIKCAEAVSKPDNSFKIALKSQANKWTCEHCLVKNDNDKTKCICCDGERSGKLKEPEKKQFNFGAVNTSFKFGIDPKVQQANLAKLAEKPAETKDKKEESETNNNVLSKTPTFSFGIPAKKPEDQSDAAKEKAEEPPKATFTFGIPKPISVAPAPAAVFEIPNKLTETKEKTEVNAKLEEVKTSASEPTPAVVMFGATTTPVSKTTTSQPTLSTAFTLEKKDVPSNPLTMPTTSAEAAPATLTFTPPASKPGAGLFGSIAVTTPTTSISFAQVSSPAASSAPASMFQKTDSTPKPLSTMFQKSEQSTTATVSLVQKSETPAVAPAPAATAPMFSFGSAQSSQPSDKPKFNFTFGSNNKTDNVFKPPTFGASDSTPKFSLGSTATENPLTTNPLAPTGNSLTGNLVSGNSLSNSIATSNPLTAGNSLQSGSGLPAATPSIFGSTVQKENMWTPPSNTSSNLFVTNATSNSLPKAPFSFGSSTPFNASSTPTFGANSTQATSTPAFGSGKLTFGSATQPTPAFGAATQPAPAPAFGSNVQSTPNIFGMPNQNSQPSPFSAPNQNSTPIFGSPQQPAAGGMQPPALGMFGRPNVGTTPTFGTPNSSIPTFEVPSLTPAQAPAFNFGSTPSTGVFGFGQQPAQQQPQQQAPGVGISGGQTGVYNFGGAPGAQGQVQFAMGSAPNAGVRRMRKAVRRTFQR